MYACIQTHKNVYIKYVKLFVYYIYLSKAEIRESDKDEWMEWRLKHSLWEEQQRDFSKKDQGWRASYVLRTKLGAIYNIILIPITRMPNNIRKVRSKALFWHFYIPFIISIGIWEGRRFWHLCIHTKLHESPWKKWSDLCLLILLI